MSNLIEELKRDDFLRVSIKTIIELKEEKPEKYPYFSNFSEALKEALYNRNHIEFYSHQIEALEKLYEGKNIIVTTPTASGKSLIYMVYTLDNFLKNREKNFLFLYPFKALAQDQLKKMNEFYSDLGFEELKAEIYDGDTPSYIRKKIALRPPNIIITNPEMLHLSFLSYFDKWMKWFEKLSMVVIDEAHIYRGVFGSNVHFLFYRLKRLVNKRLQWIGTSATIGEGKNFFEKLIGEEAALIERSGAPKPKRFLVLLQPKGSPYTLAYELMAFLLKRGVRTVTFTKARKITELIYSSLITKYEEFKNCVSSYRAGFLPEERREIEKAFFNGDLLGVVSTSAMELGIDVGGLDACILVGFPGSLVSLYQRMGRVGRGEKDAYVFLITMPDALDQYYLSHSKELIERKLEEPILNTENELIAENHILCAIKEKPLKRYEYLDDKTIMRAVLNLEKKGKIMLNAEGDKWFTLFKNPHKFINFRGIGENYEIVDKDKRVIGTIDGVRVFLECFEGAIYLHLGQTYMVKKLDTINKIVYVEACETDYYTEVRTEKEIHILEIYEKKEYDLFSVYLGRVKVKETTIGYVKKRLFSNEIISQYQLSYPPVIFETESFFIVLDNSFNDKLIEKKLDPMGSYHAIEHCMIGTFPLLALADRWDIGGISYKNYPQFSSPTIFIYEGFSDGVGISRKGFEDSMTLLRKTYEVVKDCECENGCPSCIQSPKCGNGNRPLDKEGAQFVLSNLITENQPTIIFEGLKSFENEISKKNGNELNFKSVVFDIETQNLAEEVNGWENLKEMDFAIAVLWDIENDRWLTFYKEQIDELIEILLKAERVIGFNIKRFDIPLLQEFTKKDLSRIKAIDLLELIFKKLNFRISLQSLAIANFSETKIADGIQCVKWWKEGRIDLVEQYCKKDVEITGRLYQKILKEGFLLFNDKEGRKLRLMIDIFDLQF